MKYEWVVLQQTVHTAEIESMKVSRLSKVCVLPIKCRLGAIRPSRLHFLHHKNSSPLACLTGEESRTVRTVRLSCVFLFVFLFQRSKHFRSRQKPYLEILWTKVSLSVRQHLFLSRCLRFVVWLMMNSIRNHSSLYVFTFLLWDQTQVCKPFCQADEPPSCCRNRPHRLYLAAPRQLAPPVPTEQVMLCLSITVQLLAANTPWQQDLPPRSFPETGLCINPPKLNHRAPPQNSDARQQELNSPSSFLSVLIFQQF